MTKIPVVHDLMSASKLLLARSRWHEDRAHELRSLAVLLGDVPPGSPPAEAIRELLFSARLR